MKARQLMAGIVVGLIVGLLIGIPLGVKQGRPWVDRIRLELLSDRRESLEPRIVDMAEALEQVREAARTRGLEIAEIRAQDARTVLMRIANGPAVSLQWRGMGVDSDSSRRDLDNKLINLMAVLKKANGAQVPLSQVELTK